MDRTNMNQDTQVTLEEIVGELNSQITTLNFELTASRIAIKKLQAALENSTKTTSKTVKKTDNDF
jgi:hypothetical protein